MSHPISGNRGRLAGCLAAVFQASLITGRLYGQMSGLQGTVLDATSQKPIANAEVVLVDLSVSTRSDSVGNFSILSVVPGTHDLRIRVVGFAQLNSTLLFRAAQKVDADFLLTGETVLSKVDIRSAAPTPYAIKLSEFEKRRLTGGGGSYLTTDVFEKNDGKKLADILKKRIPGINTQCKQSACYLYNSRGALTFRQKGGPCYASIVLNGIIVFNGSNGDAISMDHPERAGQPLFDLNSINSKDVIGVEYHPVSSVPAEYNATGTMCGALIVWTK
jgi:hypothetical protein